jgi:glucokinase
MNDKRRATTAETTSTVTIPDNLPLVVGLDLGGTQIRAAVLRGATLLSRVGFLTGEDSRPENVIPRMFQAVQQALDDAQVTIEQIEGIGIGAPGPLSGRSGIVFAPPNLKQWVNVPLRDIFQAQFTVPIFIENDANLAGLAEYMFGAGRGCSEVVYLTISTGVGGGVITNGQILDGISGTAAELGHITVDWRGERCNCGNIGCLETIASGTGIARRANTLIARGRGEELLQFALKQLQASNEHTATQSPIQVSAHTVALAAKAGIPQAREIIATAAEALGVGLVNIIHIFNPEIIILGGGVSQMGEPLLGPAKKIVQERTMRIPYEAVRIVIAELGADVGLVGAGALIYYHKA